MHVYTNGKELRITQDILFKKDKKYLENPSLVVEYFTNKFLSFDTDFSKNLVVALSENPTKRIVEVLIKKMEESTTYGRQLDKEESLYVAQMLIYNLGEEGSIIKPATINYEKLHTAIAFISNYENKIAKENEMTIKRVKTKNT